MPVQREEFSKYLFGSSAMLAVMAQIARSEDGRFSVPQLIEDTHLPSSTVNNALSRLKKAGLVRRTGEISSDRVIIYERRPISVWAAAEELDKEARRIGTGYVTDDWVNTAAS